jgi:peptidoglycan/LPS O-acetylase OafA/YrhL
MLLVLAIVGGSNLRSLMVSAVFMRDYRIGALDFALAHTWSLGVEEKFYLLWPWAMIFFSRRALAWLCAALLVALPIVRVATYVFDPSAREIIPIMFHTRADTIAIGCLLAIFWDDLLADKRINALYSPIAAGVSLFVLFFISPAMTTIFGGIYLLPIGLSLDGIAATVLITYSIRSYSWFGRMLNWRPAVFVGVLSYSIYLWQQMALDHAQSWLGALAPRLLFALVASLLSYFFIEQPFIKLGKRLHRRPLALSSARPAE